MNFNIFLQVFSNLEGLASVDYHAKYEHQTSLKELFVCILWVSNSRLAVDKNGYRYFLLIFVFR